MAKQRQALRTYILQESRIRDGFDLVLAEVGNEHDDVILQSKAGESKDQFEIRCRRYVRSGCPESGDPRKLMIRGKKGKFVDEASYDCDDQKKRG